MSSIRLFILSSFAEYGPMHGHRLRLEAEARRVHLWTDISVGAVYGAMQRLAREGLLKESGREQHGNRPTRQLYEITEDGRRALKDLRREGLRAFWFKPDPFDLALTLMDADALDSLPRVLAERLEEANAKLSEIRKILHDLRDYIGAARNWALRHTEYRLQGEIAYIGDLLKTVNDVVRDERHPEPRKAKPR
jgi:DNA-binding PadR family transcriptional regulator